MDPTPTCCPTGHCPARGQTGQGTLGSHARQEPRCIGHACDKTCRAPTGTVCSRLRPSADTVVIIVTWLAQGCPVPALVAACGGDERTGAAGWARSGRQGQAVQEDRFAPPRDLGQGHADALGVKTQGGIGWMALAMMVKTR
jgi:hypothetical protein